MSFVAVAIGGSAVLGAASSIYAGKKANKAIDKAMANQKTVDIGKLVADARVNAENNLKTSLQLEQKYLPGQAAVRGATEQNFLSQLDPSGQGALRREQALQQLFDFTSRGGEPTYTGSATFRSAADSILADLGLGGQLDADTQSAVMRGALAGAGRAGIVGSEAGRGLVARDLGLTSMQVRNARQQAALQAGQIESQLGLAAAQNYLQSLGLQIDATTGQLRDAANIFQMGANLPRPEGGLSAGDIASAEIAQTNAYNQNLMNAAGIRSANNTAMIGGVTQSLQQGLGLLGSGGSLGTKTSYGPTASPPGGPGTYTNGIPDWFKIPGRP